MTLGLHRCGLPIPGRAEVPCAGGYFFLCCLGPESTLATVAASVLSQVPSLPISG